MDGVKRRRQARKLADARNLVGLANDTKWTEFFKEIEQLEIPLQIKLLYEEEAIECPWVSIPSRNYVDSNYGPELFVFIEWLRSSTVDDISSIAKTVGLVFSIEDGQITVYGYR